MATNAFNEWKLQTQSIFDYSVLIHYAVPALKQHISLVERGDLNGLSRPDYYRSHKPNAYTEPALCKDLKRRASEYKAQTSKFMILSLFSYFEAFVVDIIKEFLDFHGGASALNGFAVKKAKRSILMRNGNSKVKRWSSWLKPTTRKAGRDYKAAARQLVDVGYFFPSDFLSAYGIYMLGVKIKDLKSKDIPEVLINALHMDLDEKLVKEFHRIRDIRNNIAHGRHVNLTIKDVTDFNSTLMTMAKKIDSHVYDFFLVYEKYAI